MDTHSWLWQPSRVLHVEANRNSAYTVSLVSTKGGVGKSTLTANISALCADLGLRVLVIDCDTQASMSKFFRIAERAESGLGRVLRTRQIDADCISRTEIENLDLIVCDADVLSASPARALHWPGVAVNLRLRLSDERP